MLFKSLLTLALAAVSFAAPAPAAIGLEDRAVTGLARISVSLSVAVNNYQSNPSAFDIRVRLCAAINALTDAQRVSILFLRLAQ